MLYLYTVKALGGIPAGNHTPMDLLFQWVEPLDMANPEQVAGPALTDLLIERAKQRAFKLLKDNYSSGSIVTSVAFTVVRSFEDLEKKFASER